MSSLPAGVQSLTALSSSTPLMCAVYGAGLARKREREQQEEKKRGFNKRRAPARSKSEHYRVASFLLSECRSMFARWQRDAEELGLLSASNGKKRRGGKGKEKEKVERKRKSRRHGRGAWGGARAKRRVDGCTALHLAAAFDLPEIARLLVEWDEEEREEGEERLVAIKDAFGNTPLHYAYANQSGGALDVLDAAVGSDLGDR